MTEHFSKWSEFAATKGLRLLAIVIIALILIRLLKALTSRLVEMAKAQTRSAQAREQQTRTMAGMLSSAGIAVILGIAFLAALPEFGFNVAPVAALAGLASLAFGFGAQYLVRDLINGFLIVFEDQYVVGDIVRINDVAGRVESITIRRTILRSEEGALVSIPNGMIGQVSNLNRDWSQIFVDVTVPGEETLGRALAVLEKVAGEFRDDPDWTTALVDGPRVLGVESLSLSGIVLRTRVRSAPTRQYDIARELRRRIKSGFEQAQIPSIAIQRVELAGRDQES
jgi:moderate conductance mechanosensitive channel